MYFVSVRSRSLFFFQDHVVIGQEKDEYVEIEKLKYDAITHSNLKQTIKIQR